MSRTDVHRPWLVQQADPYDRNNWYRFASWPDEMELVPLRCLCGCRMCTGHYGRKQGRRRERVAWRIARQQLLAAVDRDNVDAPPARCAAW